MTRGRFVSGCLGLQEEPSQTYAFVLNEAQAVNWYDPWFESSSRWVSYLCNLPSMAVSNSSFFSNWSGAASVDV